MWCRKLGNSECGSEIPGEFWGVVLVKGELDQLGDRVGND